MNTCKKPAPSTVLFYSIPEFAISLTEISEDIFCTLKKLFNEDSEIGIGTICALCMIGTLVLACLKGIELYVGTVVCLPVVYLRLRPKTLHHLNQWDTMMAH